jgi:signal transduction histidine kinase
MIGQILDLTRSRLANGLQIVAAPMDLCAVLSDIADELRTAHPTHTIALHCDPLHGAWDRDRLEQVFSNLIGNALHYGSPDHPVTVSARRETNSIVVDVHNQGAPIPDELQAKLFDPFRRGTRDSRTATTEGLGLGLFISREIVLAHGGDISVTSSESQGTTFRVRLPSLPPSAPSSST